MKTLLALLLSVTAAPLSALDRRSGPSPMTMRRQAEAARPPAMSLRRFTPGGKDSPAPPNPPPGPTPGTPAPKTPTGPGITPPPAGPQPPFDRWHSPGAWTYAAAGDPRVDPPARSIRDEALEALRGPGPAVARLSPGQTGRSFGGASDPVVFLTEAGAGGGTPASPPAAVDHHGRSTDPVAPPGQERK